ncbi:unnamed protein product [Closterium sp. Naga37s-1]|nr:unnamed protein product [Closterium sp. Naga37s-1]
MGKGRNNKAGKKTVDNGQEKELADVPDVPVKAPSSSTSPAVLGPFDDLSDLQNKADHTNGPGGEDADGVDRNAVTDHAAADEEADADADAQEDEEASSDRALDDVDDGYLSDDSDEHLEPVSLGSIIALKRFSLTLLVPILRKAEVKRAAVTVAALLDDWKEQLSPEIISHECVNGDIIDLTWQHPEDPRFLRERLLNPTAKEVVVKGVPAEITAELIPHLLVVSKLVKRGRSAFASGFGFHRTVDPVTGLETDRIRGLIVPHAGVVLTSTGGVREEWVCVQTVCEKAQGNHFEQAAAYVASARHKGGLKKDGAATRASKHSQKMAAFKREFMAVPAKK